jgi:glycosyltransferase involved in cell wall biosynthesis
MNPSSRRLLWLQSPPWDGVWTRQNHFARRFAAAGAEVLYVENPPALRARLEQEGFAGVLGAGRAAREVEPRLRVLRLPLQVPGSRQSGLVGALNGLRFAHAVQDAVRGQGWDDYVAWCRVPGSYHALRHLRPRAVVYDVTDDYELYARSGREKGLTRKLERKLLARADLVFTTTATLRDKLALFNDNVRVVPNGVDPAFFEEPDAEDDPLAAVPHPRIGFVGLIARWMDFELLRKLAARWPGHVVVVGPVQREVEASLRGIEGLLHVPKVAHLEVPRYLRAFDVCIMPHEISELRHRADPLKVVEYLAAGKPIVSVALRSLEPLSALVDLAADHQTFLELVEQRLRQPRPELRQERRRVAAARSWDQLFGEVTRALDALPA